MAASKVFTLRLDPKLRQDLDQLAEATQRSRSFLMTEAVREYVALNAWQIAETRRAVAEADAGDFADDRMVQRTLKKWSRRAG